MYVDMSKQAVAAALARPHSSASRRVSGLGAQPSIDSKIILTQFRVRWFGTRRPAT